jgi:hypothetical protein
MPHCSQSGTEIGTWACTVSSPISQPSPRDALFKEEILTSFLGGLPTLKKLISDSANAQLQSVQVDPNTPTKPLDQLAFLNGLTGDVMSAPEIPNFHRLRRSKLRALLVKDLDIRWNKRLSNVVFEHDGKSVTALFEDGDHISGRLIIGADGARSSVRKILLGPEISPPTRLPYSATFVQAKYNREQALFLRSFHPLYIAAPHPDGYFAFFGLQDAPQVDKPEDWYVSAPSPCGTFFFFRDKGLGIFSRAGQGLSSHPLVY